MARPLATLAAGLTLALLASPLAAAGPAAEADKPAKWSVEEPRGEFKEVTIDVTEGTWLSLDLSPDGRELVFDLLGDLFIMPVSGGEARQLTRGHAWDMQPRFSPDGQRIVFVSDRDGLDNIWTIARDGSDPRQVTKEKTRGMHNPDWAPDGDWIVARKHLTKTRSAGTGEMWLYHRDGGDGLQLTEKPNDQKDVNEPAFSPDGRYLYFSQDTTPGTTFQYNKDSTGQIYVIRRLDRHTGQLQDYITGAGGAVRPTPSPDGKSIAFVRRWDGKSWLWLKDVASGQVTRLHGPVERDMQEIWAMQGVFPGFAWTPDSRQLVYWTGGKFWRLDVASRQQVEIPFRVRKSMRIYDALRVPVEVAPETFHTRMLRFVAVAPQGDKVVFEALGKLWVRDLPSGKPRRLTRQEDHFELHPQFSRDGRSIVYTTWDDERFGSVRVIAASGGSTGRTITREPGHYAAPTFSPDGRTVVYEKLRGGVLRNPAWGEEPGIYAVASGGGTPSKVADEGRTPQFGADPTRVYLMRFTWPDKAELVSLDLDGSDERKHVTNEWATELRISPDERWVAWTERNVAYVAAFTPTGKPIALGPKASSVPVARVSRDAGDWLQFSADASRLHWATGPVLFERALKDAFDFLAGSPEKPLEPPAEGIDLGFSVPSDRPEGRIALVGARIVTMRGDEVIADGTLIVERDRIQAIGPRASTPVPAGTRVIDVSGRTIVPGLVDVHWHGSYGEDEMIPEQSWEMLANLTFGVTTTHNPSTDTSEMFAAAELARAGHIVAPRLFSTGTILYGATAIYTAPIDDYSDALSNLRRLKSVGAFSVKSYNQPRRDQRQMVLAAGRELGMLVVPEGGVMFNANMSMLVDGHTSLEHSLSPERLYDDVVQLWRQSRMAYVPTLGVAYGGLTGEYYWYETTDVWRNDKLARFVPRGVLEPRARRRQKAPLEDYNHIPVARGAKQLADAGVLVATGAHGQREGLALHWEMWMLAQGGMTPLQALRAATLEGARMLGMERDIGSLEPGKLADLVVIDGDPLADIRVSERVTHTMVNGRLYDAATMHEIGNRSRQRAPLWFEADPAAGAAVTRSNTGGHGGH